MISPDRLTMRMKALSMVLFCVVVPILIMMAISSSFWAGLELSWALPDGKLPDADGGRAAVLGLHSHWPNGRFHDHGPEEVRRMIAEGGERFEIGGRHPLQACCAQLIRMGCIVFQYDMLGYADSVQFEHLFWLGPPNPGPSPADNSASL